MTDRDRIDAMIQGAVSDCYPYWSIVIADHLIAGGVVVREKGEWIPIEETMFNLERPVIVGWECSKCGEQRACEQNFCPNCGSDMRKVENG